MLIFAEGGDAWQSLEVICNQQVWVPGLSGSPGLSEPGKAHRSDSSVLLKLCCLKTCHSPNALLMGTDNCGE